MPITVTLDADKSLLDACGHSVKLITGSIAFTGTYLTNGEELDLSELLPKKVAIVTVESKAGYIFEYVYSTKKVKAYYPTKAQAVAASGGNQPTVTTGSATASAVDTTTPSVTIPAGFRSAVDSGVAQEVPNGVVLTALTDVRFLAIGM